MIRRAGPAHPALLAAIHATAFPPGEAWSEAIFAAQLGLPGIFALYDERGAMILARNAADEAEILTLAVSPGQRRQGLAHSLLGAALALAAERGATAIFLEVSASNAPARALYAGAGFTEIGRRRAYYPDGSDALLLRRPLDAPGQPSAGASPDSSVSGSGGVSSGST